MNRLPGFKPLAMSSTSSQCRITKLELLTQAARHVGRAFTCWPLKRHYGFRSWEMAADFVDNTWLCLRGSWKARWS